MNRFKIVSSFFALACVLCSTFMFAACGVTPMAYVKFVAPEGCEVQYTSYMYDYSHIIVYENPADRPDGNDPQYTNNGARYMMDCEAAAVITVKFKRNLGYDEQVGALCVDIDRYCDMTVTVKKTGNTIYSPSKAIYINGTLVTPTMDDDASTVRIFTFQNVSFNRSNEGGHIDASIINRLEYK